MKNRNIIISLMVVVIFLSVLPIFSMEENDIKYEVGKILFSKEIPLTTDEIEIGVISSYEIQIILESGQHKGQIFNSAIQSDKLYQIRPAKNVKYIVHVEKDDGTGKIEVHILQRYRVDTLLYMLILFILSVIIIGGKKGALALIAIGGIVIFILFAFIPLIIKGYSPIFLAVVVCILATVLTMVLTNGFSMKSLASIIGTAGGVTVSGILAYWAGTTMVLSGVMEHQSVMLFYSTKGKLDLQGILFAGIIIGALGAVMDVSVSIASSLHEIKIAKPDVTVKELFFHGKQIGTDVISTMINTLILAYLGSSLSLILLLKIQHVSPMKFMSFDLISSEITRALAGSIGIVMTIPLTAFLASWLYIKYDEE